MDAEDAKASSQRPVTVSRRAERDWALRPLGSPAQAGPSRLWRWVGTLGGCFLGAVLLVAVWGKALDPQGFVELLQREGLLAMLPGLATTAARGTAAATAAATPAAAAPMAAVPVAAMIAALVCLAIEAGIGMALLLGVRRWWILLPATLMVMLFVALNGRGWWLATHGQVAAGASCGCFGNLVQRTPAEAFWQDLLLLVPALALAWVGRDRGRPARQTARLAAIALFTALVAAFAWWAPELPLDDLATRLKPGVTAGQLCVGDPGSSGACLNTVAPDLDRGDHLVVLDDIDDPTLARAVPALNAYANTPRAATVWVLTTSDDVRQRAFFWKWGPTFKIVQAPPELLRPLYRRLPRSFAVQDGRVTATFPGLPPLPHLGVGAADPHNPSTRPNR